MVEIGPEIPKITNGQVIELYRKDLSEHELKKNYRNNEKNQSKDLSHPKRFLASAF